MKSKLLKQASACRKEFTLDISKIILYNVPKGSTFKMFGTKVGGGGGGGADSKIDGLGFSLLRGIVK